MTLNRLYLNINRDLYMQSTVSSYDTSIFFDFLIML